MKSSTRTHSNILFLLLLALPSAPAFAAAPNFSLSRIGESAAPSAEINPTLLEENFSDLETAMDNAKKQASLISAPARAFRWIELERFQTALWRALALDPSVIAAVPPAQVPKELFANELNEDLSNQLEGLKKSTYPKDYHFEAEFAAYSETVSRLVEQRMSRQFPQVRAFAKRGYLDEAYAPLQKKILQIAEVKAPSGLSAPLLNAFHEIESITLRLRETATAPPKDLGKHEVFANGTRFMWYTVSAIFGFFLGLAAFRLNPDFFQKILDQMDSSQTPTATTHSAGASPLDYNRWLREFEEILSRLKSSQLTHERRIEGIVQNSEKITQHSLSLYADARIKNEANLEYRMSSLVREVQNQFDQSQKLQVGDRVQVNLMLEHCLKLCDAVETNAIHLDRVKLSESNAA